MVRPRASLVLCLTGLACASTPDANPVYAPTENVLEVVAVLRRHVPDDTYRFEPARDFTGRNVYRSSLLRLENLESRQRDALRAGHLDGVIAFAKGRALERLRAYDLAAEAYRHRRRARPRAARRGAAQRRRLRRAASRDHQWSRHRGAGCGCRRAGPVARRRSPPR